MTIDPQLLTHIDTSMTSKPRFVAPLFLASVMSVEEAAKAQSGGADIIDCKDAARGALGALPVSVVAAIRRSLPAGIPVSATIGDIPSEPGPVVAAVMAMARSGADDIKIGFFPGGNARATIAALGACDPNQARLVGLLLADRDPDFSLLADMARAGFRGVMVDTAGKAGTTLRDHMSEAKLAEFVKQARAFGLFCGFAGSLGLSDIATLMRLKPNVLGFRGALCAGADRTGRLSLQAVRAVTTEIERNARLANQPLSPAATTGAAK